MNLPHWNRLTGLRWWRHLKPRDKSDEARQRDDTKIADLLQAPQPCAIGKIGTTELLGLEYLSRWIQPPWPPPASWRRPARRLYDCSGLFPVRRDIFFRWAAEYQAALESLDIVAQWQPGSCFEGVLEDKVIGRFCPKASRVGRFFVRILAPQAKWLDDLAGLRWLVVHPFTKTIQSQLPRLAELGVFSDSSRPALEQRARDTRRLACPQFAYMQPPRHRDWFHALETIQAEMDKERDNFDIALVGAGAWSLPLVAHAKKLGKKGIHLGGALQLLFGIKGGRYDRWGVYNQAWIRPLNEEVPSNFHQMEQGAYW